MALPAIVGVTNGHSTIWRKKNNTMINDIFSAWILVVGDELLIVSFAAFLLFEIFDTMFERFLP